MASGFLGVLRSVWGAPDQRTTKTNEIFFVVSLGSREIRESAAAQLHRSSRRDGRADMFLRSKLEARVHLDTQLLLLQDAGKDGH